MAASTRPPRCGATSSSGAALSGLWTDRNDVRAAGRGRRRLATRPTPLSRARAGDRASVSAWPMAAVTIGPPPRRHGSRTWTRTCCVERVGDCAPGRDRAPPEIDEDERMLAHCGHVRLAHDDRRRARAAVPPAAASRPVTVVFEREAAGSWAMALDLGCCPDEDGAGRTRGAAVLPRSSRGVRERLRDRPR